MSRRADPFRFVFAGVLVGSLALAAVLLAPRLRAGGSRDLAPPPAEPTPTASPPASASATRMPPPIYVHVDPATPASCAAGMVLVDGVYCPSIAHRCTAFIDEATDVCQSYEPEVMCEGGLQRRRFCIDVFEYPNLEGVVPVVMVDWNEARRACGVEGKRLCTVEEWEFACEGPQMWPYPYGIERDPTACNIDKPPPDDPARLADPWKVSDEVARVDQRVVSGEPPRCVSPFGVRDMTGNVDEWVTNPAGGRLDKPFRSTLKGGSWGRGRSRCRPMTTTHDESFESHDVGFRCCSDLRGGQPATRLLPGEPVRRKRRMDQP